MASLVPNSSSIIGAVCVVNNPSHCGTGEPGRSRLNHCRWPWARSNVLNRLRRAPAQPGQIQGCLTEAILIPSTR